MFNDYYNSNTYYYSAKDIDSTVPIEEYLYTSSSSSSESASDSEFVTSPLFSRLNVLRDEPYNLTGDEVSSITSNEEYNFNESDFYYNLSQLNSQDNFVPVTTHVPLTFNGDPNLLSNHLRITSSPQNDLHDDAVVLADSLPVFQTPYMRPIGSLSPVQEQSNDALARFNMEDLPLYHYTRTTRSLSPVQEQDASAQSNLEDLPLYQNHYTRNVTFLSPIQEVDVIEDDSQVESNGFSLFQNPLTRTSTSLAQVNVLDDQDDGALAQLSLVNLPLFPRTLTSPSSEVAVLGEQEGDVAFVQGLDILPPLQDLYALEEEDAEELARADNDDVPLLEAPPSPALPPEVEEMLFGCSAGSPLSDCEEEAEAEEDDDDEAEAEAEEADDEEEAEEEDEEEDEEEEEIQAKKRKRAASGGAGEKKKKKRKTSAPFVCPVCGHVSKRKYNLGTHLLTHDHDRVKQFKCFLCEKAFDRRHDRERHMATVHRLERNHGCQHCGAKFTRGDALRRHLVHSHGYEA